MFFYIALAMLSIYAYIHFFSKDIIIISSLWAKHIVIN
jgi:hypothetical protein